MTGVRGSGADPVGEVLTGRVPRTIPDATIARLPLYLRALTALSDAGLATVSSGELADASGVSPAQLRKDLSHLGSYGVRGVGYDVATLTDKIGAQIGSTEWWSVVIVGMGNLGSALARYSGYATRGFHVAALVDASPALIGQQVTLDGPDPQTLTIRGDDELADIVAGIHPVIGVITTPAEPAQGVCDRLVEAGVRSILSFAPTVLSVPDGVALRAVDLGQELQILAYHQQHPRTDPLDLRPGADGDGSDVHGPMTSPPAREGVPS
ncbi:redox-sensing transcriptional repressor Rex [Desertihabitans brevis]|uniref:redox-sensing transcriptional repressor Rex n=1 Tax=Desertihabitans brevis TaxID=2268447 RepID=UPI0026D8BCA9|nr:redox-sensing transcriptional repressor Rex [Desertihabitans brevis]